MDYKDVIDNAINELNRAIERIKELGTFEEVALTDDELLVNDMKCSVERLSELDCNL